MADLEQTGMCSLVEILYNPYQGLKLLLYTPKNDTPHVEILYNPYQGLKR